MSEYKPGDGGIDMSKHEPQIDKIVEEIKNLWHDRPQPSERNIVLYRGCHSRGKMVEFTDFCGDPTCEPCRFHLEMFDKTVREKFSNDDKKD